MNHIEPDQSTEANPPAKPEDKWAVMSVELATPGGKIRGNVRIDTGPMRLADLVPTAQELTNVFAARANRKSEQQGKKITCCAGCGACCRQLVPLSPPEALYMADMIDSMDPIRRAAALGQFETIEKRLEKEDMIEPMLDMLVGSDPYRSLNRTYFAMRMACPFLSNESCDIHADRPVACREYNVTSPALFCQDPFGNAVEKVPMPLPFSAPLAWLTSDLTGTPPQLVPLTLVPRWVAEHSEWRRLHWPGLELFKKFMEIAGGPPRVESPDCSAKD